MRKAIGSMLVALLVSACQGELHGRLDILPQRYPNRLEQNQHELDAVLFSPPNAFGVPGSAHAVARAVSTDGGGAAVPSEARGSVTFRDLDGDGRLDAVARFAVEDVRGLLGSHSHGLEVRIEGDGVSWVGNDRVFAPEAPLIELPQPSGPHAVGTAALLGVDATRPGPSRDGRALLVRLWYPAAPTETQPAPYFLDPVRAERNLSAGPFQLPPDLFELTHGFARAHVPPASFAQRPVLLLSTGWDAPIEIYSALAEDFASHGYLVLGINHPNGSGAVVYPERNNADWALDLRRLAEWIGGADGGAALEPVGLDADVAAHAEVRAALAQADAQRITALGHSFGGAAAMRADAESLLIRASVNLDGPILGDITGIARNTSALVLLSPGHSELDSSIRHFEEATGGRARCYAVAGTRHANFGDTGWLFERLLAENPDLQREGYGLGPLPPDRAHQVVSGLARDFFNAELAGSSAPAPVGAEYPEVAAW
jgi:predicted dienelactone hydrolase